ncbi:MAG TPA: TetR/AcrR family transcriptional regulator [Aestuariivirgaceae bacterium]|nr:TetR/AcrR family transcriptional regulator [Aestuariivirgaceae bacterium]
MSHATTQKVVKTKAHILAAARRTLVEHGFAGLSTRRVAQIADAPMSQIQYHFGSKEGMLVALFEDMNAALLERQGRLFDDPDLTLAEQWDVACDFLEDDLNSGYVQILQELIAAGWSNPAIRAKLVEGLDGWSRLLAVAVRRAERRLGSFSPLSADDVAALIGAAFLGAEGQILLGREDRLQQRRALRRIGDVIRRLEHNASGGKS